MKHTEGNFEGHGGNSLFYQGWLPDGRIGAILLVVHGLAEHSGRCLNLVNRFVPLGYAVYGFDLQGHGRSEGLRGYVKRFSYYLDDLKTFMGIVREKHGDIRIFIVGCSMGGTIAANYALTNQDELAGLILSGVSVRLGTDVSPMLVKFSKVLAALVPKLGVKVIDASAISRDDRVVEAYDNDPLVYRGKISARLGAEFVEAMQPLRRRASEIKSPLLIMHGIADRLSDPRSSEELYQRAGSEDKTLRLYDGFYHEIFNEFGHEQVFADMEAWLDARA
jgi:alpha-beta hydrolase superfamily lysophospholipase